MENRVQFWMTYAAAVVVVIQFMCLADEFIL